MGGKVNVSASIHPYPPKPIESTFDCTEQAGTLLGLFGEHWMFEIVLFDANNQLVWDADAMADVPDGKIVDLGNFEIAYLGQLSVSWTLMSGGTPTDCAAHGAAKTRLVTNRLNPAAPDKPTNILTIVDFPCTAGSGTTMELESG